MHNLVPTRAFVVRDVYVVFNIGDNGGRRAGIERRRFSYSDHIPERRRDLTGDAGMTGENVKRAPWWSRIGWRPSTAGALLIPICLSLSNLYL